MSDLCLVAAMVAKMQAAEQSVSLGPAPAALDQVSRQAKHNSYKFAADQSAYKSVYYSADRPTSGPMAASPSASRAVGFKQVATSSPGAEFSSALARTGQDCSEASPLAAKILSEETRLAARTSSSGGAASTVARSHSASSNAARSDEALSKLTSPLYWEKRPTVVPSPQPRAIDRPAAIAPARNLGPRSGPQLYHQRLAAIKAGRLYTRLPADSFRAQWINASAHPDYKQWTHLLAVEARAVSKGQGSNRLSIVVGDSLSQWLPMQNLSNAQIWMNQGISGDTTRGILQRISAFKDTKPSSIYLMAGVNDLKNGATDAEVLSNLRRIMRQLRANHPQAQVFVQSILPTSTPQISNDRIRQINTQLTAIAREENVSYLNLHSRFTNDAGQLNANLTTDGIHLSPEGYGVWQSILRNMEYWVALNRNLGSQTPWAS